MKKSTLLALTAALLAAAPVSTMLAVVSPADQFDIEVDAFNYDSGYSAEAVTPTLVTFGTTSTFSNTVPATTDTYNVTVSSSEVVGATTTTDTVTVSTPDNFIPPGYVLNSNPQQIADGVEFDIGINRQTGGTLDYLTPLSYSSTTLTDVFFVSAVPEIVDGEPSLLLSNDGFSLTSISYIYNKDGSAISADGVNSYTLTNNYPTISVPEPSAYVEAGLGALALGTVLWRRNRRQAGLLL